MLNLSKKVLTLTGWGTVKDSKLRSALYITEETKHYIKYLTASIIIGYQNLNDKINRKPKKIIEHPADTVILHQFPRVYNKPNLSPYALKLETWCRAYDVKYQNQYTMERLRKGLIPFIKLNGYIVEDSQRCIEYLSFVFQRDYNSHLTEKQKATARLIVKLCNDSLKGSMALMRYVHYENSMKDMNMQKLVFWFYSYRVRCSTKKLGIYGLEKEEVIKTLETDLKALNTLLGDRKYFFNNDKPCDADFAVFGIVTQFVYVHKGLIDKFMKENCKGLLKHSGNLRTTYWKEWNIERKEL